MSQEASGRPRYRITVSVGAWADLLHFGKITDAGSGHELRLDRETCVVAVHHRGTGEQLDIPVLHPRQLPDVPAA